MADVQIEVVGSDSKTLHSYNSNAVPRAGDLIFLDDRDLELEVVEVVWHPQTNTARLMTKDV